MTPGNLKIVVTGKLGRYKYRQMVRNDGLQFFSVRLAAMLLNRKEVLNVNVTSVNESSAYQ